MIFTDDPQQPFGARQGKPAATAIDRPESADPRTVAGDGWVLNAETGKVPTKILRLNKTLVVIRVADNFF
jgi:hypothetical protein